MTDTVIVVGGGLAGIACAQGLAKRDVGVTLVDRNDYHQFQPLLYQVATSQLPVMDIAQPLRTLFKDDESVDVVLADVADIKTVDRSVVLSDGRVLTADVLVLAAGAQPNYFGVTGADELSFPLYSVADAERLRLHVQRLIRGALGVGDDGVVPDGPGALDIVIVGAGPTGVETAGAMAELMTALHAKGGLSYPSQITIVDHGSVLLAQFSDKAHHYAFEKLTQAGVRIRLGVGVTAVHADAVELDDGTVLPTRTIVWAGGESAARVAATAEESQGRGGRIDVLPDLTVPATPSVYAIGDVANIPSGEATPLPQLGSVAQQSGTWAAANILRDLQGEDREAFRYKDKGIMAMIGRNAAVAEVGRHRHQVDGPLAFSAWLGVHAMLLSGVHSRTDAFMSWAWDYVNRDHSAIVESQSNPSRILWGEDGADVPHISLERSSAS